MSAWIACMEEKVVWSSTSASMARITVTTERKRERVTSQSAIRRPRDCSALLSVVPKWIAVHTGEVATAEAVEGDVQMYVTYVVTTTRPTWNAIFKTCRVCDIPVGLSSLSRRRRLGFFKSFEPINDSEERSLLFPKFSIPWLFIPGLFSLFI